MAKSEHEWGSQQYDQEWVDKDSRRAAERAAQFTAALSWLSVFVSRQSRVMDLGCGPCLWRETNTAIVGGFRAE